MSSSFPDALTFMESVAGFSQHIAKAEAPSANAPIRIAVIDPSYVHYTYPGTLPKVTFEGEETMSEKRYVVIDRSYKPGGGDRVVMIPVGHTYVIAGVITPAEVPPFFDQQTQTGTVSTSNTSFVSLSGGPTATIDLRAGQYAEVIVSCQMFASTTAVTGVLMSFRVTGASGTQAAQDPDGHETGHVDEWTPMSRTTIWGPASSGGSHSFESQYRVIGTVTGNYKNRRIIAKALN